jgi:AbrB family looped-hinge helix DNA binding protein
MGKVTSKLQVTIPKAIADQFGIRPGNELDWIPSGDAIRVVPTSPMAADDELKRRLQLFDEATARQAIRQKIARKRGTVKDRGWKREELYRRGRPG